MLDVFIFSDTHCNSRVGLCAPGVLDDEGAEITRSSSQVWLWAQWLDYCKLAKRAQKAGRTVYVIGLGDLVDANSHDGFQLHEPLNTATMLRIARESLRPLLKYADKTFLVRGTAAHTGGAGCLEEMLAETMKPDYALEPDSERGTLTWWALEAALPGLNLAVTHHPGTNSMRPWTQGGGANRAAAMTVATYYGQAWQPDLAVFAHVHHNEDSYDNHPVRAIFNRAWKLADSYDARSGRALLARAVGGLLVHVDADGWRVEKFIREMPKPQPWRAE